MTTALLTAAGAGIGLGLYLFAAALVPARPALTDALAAPRRPQPQPRPAATGLTAGAGRPAAALLAALGLPGRKTRADLRALGREPEQHLAQQAGLALAALLAFPLFALALALGGVRLPLVI